MTKHSRQMNFSVIKMNFWYFYVLIHSRSKFNRTEHTPNTAHVTFECRRQWNPTWATLCDNIADISPSSLWDQIRTHAVFSRTM